MLAPEIARLFDLTGKTAIVTGGARGIGQAIAFLLARAGASVLITDINREAAEQTVEQITQAGGYALFMYANANDFTTTPLVIDTAVATFGGLHILVNNAGIFPSVASLEMSEQEWDRVVNSNLKSTFFYCQSALRQMRQTGEGGKIINIATTDAVRPTQGLAHYSAAKAGIVMLTRSLALEFGKYRVNVNAIAPGFIDTPGTRAARQAAMVPEQFLHVSREEAAKAFLAKRPLGRLGEPDDVAKAVLFLASSASDYITGDLLVVDGGYLLS